MQQGDDMNNKKLAKTIRDSTGSEYALIRAVMKQLGGIDEEIIGTLQDVSDHGAEGGFVGFTYYKDTSDFFDVNREEILSVLEEYSDDVDEPISTMVCSTVDVTAHEAYRTLYGDEDNHLVANWAAWFALEHVAHEVMNMQEEV